MRETDIEPAEINSRDSFNKFSRKAENINNRERELSSCNTIYKLHSLKILETSGKLQYHRCSLFQISISINSLVNTDLAFV